MDVKAQANYLFTRAMSLSTYGGARVSASITDGCNFAYANNGPDEPAIPHEKKPRRRGACAEVMALSYWVRAWPSSPAKSCIVARAKRTRRAGPWMPGLARPCSYCMSTLKAFGVKEVVYTTGEVDVNGKPEIAMEYV